MEMQHIRYFLALCEERNFTRAAKRCGVAQPSLTRAIARLEKELGVPLFVRSRKTTDLTSLGRALRPHLLDIERSAAAVRREAAKHVTARGGRSVRPQERAARKSSAGAASIIA
jgi:LysR family hydrogen peroxide-inducible transcriptional activator